MHHGKYDRDFHEITDNPYIITKAEELTWFRDKVNGGNNKICAKIANNVEVIDMSKVCHASDASKKIESPIFISMRTKNM